MNYLWKIAEVSGQAVPAVAKSFHANARAEKNESTKKKRLLAAGFAKMCLLTLLVFTHYSIVNNLICTFCPVYTEPVEVSVQVFVVLLPSVLVSQLATLQLTNGSRRYPCP